MAANKRHEDSIGKTFRSTLLKVERLDTTSLDKDYDFLRVISKSEEDHTPIISDPKDEFSDGRICGTCAEGRTRFIMLRKNHQNLLEFRTYLDTKGDDFICDQVFAVNLKEKILVKLLLNSSLHELNDYLVYNNMDGKMYITYPKWRTNDHITTAKVTVDQKSMGLVLNISATMFSRIGSYKDKEEQKKMFSKPMYSFSKEDGMAHRVFEPSPKNYVEGNSGNNKAEIPYSDPSTSDKLKLSKNYIYDLVIDDINTAFDRYIHIEKESMRIDDYLDPEGIDVELFMDELKSKIEDADYAIINTIPEIEKANELERIVRETLKEKFGKDAETHDAPVEGKFNLRIIHDDKFYKMHKQEDEYKKFPGFIVQHLTIENCITGRKDDAVDSIMNVLIKELFIKDCISREQDLIGNWGSRGFEGKVEFLKRVQVSKKPRRYVVYRLTIQPDGKFGFDILDDSDALLFEMRNIWRDNKSTSDIEHAIIYKDSACVIENSGIVPVIDNEVLMEAVVKLEQKRKELKDVQETDETENSKKKRATVPDGEGPRGYQTYNNALYAITDIQRLSFGDNLLYMCGYDGTDMARKYDKAPNIRLVRCIRGENFFSELLELMNVPFVRHGQTTVYPYPYKFLTEYIEEQKRM